MALPEPLTIRQADYPLMHSYADIYVLAPSRSEATVKGFLARFIPDRAETADEYWIPQGVDSPHTILQGSAEVIAYCCGHPAESQSVYWHRIGDGLPSYAMILFTSDGYLILGLTTHEHLAGELFDELRSHADSDVGYITVGTPPPRTAAEFRRIAHQAAR